MAQHAAIVFLTSQIDFAVPWTPELRSLPFQRFDVVYERPGLVLIRKSAHP